MPDGFRLVAELRTELCGLQINWAMNDKQEFIDIVEVVYRGARKGRGLVVSPKGKSYRHCSPCCTMGIGYFVPTQYRDTLS